MGERLHYRTELQTPPAARVHSWELLGEVDAHGGVRPLTLVAVSPQSPGLLEGKARLTGSAVQVLPLPASAELLQPCMELPALQKHPRARALHCFAGRRVPHATRNVLLWPTPRTEAAKRRLCLVTSDDRQMPAGLFPPPCLK